MKPGIFAKTFPRDTLDQTFEAVEDLGLEAVQFNFACCGLPSLPDAIPDDLPAQIGLAAHSHGLEISAVSCTFNMIHPDPARRRAGLEALGRIASCCDDMGTGLVTLCTGTRDPDDQWRAHPDNRRQDAWRDLLASVDQAIDGPVIMHGFEEVDAPASARFLTRALTAIS